MIIKSEMIGWIKIKPIDIYELFRKLWLLLVNGTFRHPVEILHKWDKVEENLGQKYFRTIDDNDNVEDGDNHDDDGDDDVEILEK